MAMIRAQPNDLVVGAAATIQFAQDVLLDVDIALFTRSALVESDANFCQISAGGFLLAVEVADLDLAYDKQLKARLCARHSVREFWVIDANERIAWIHTGPSGEDWASIVERGPNEVLATPALPRFSIKLGDIE
jgi:hypothetical protein